MIKYIGSKRTLIDDLLAILGGFPELRSVADLFSGTSRCGHAFKRAGFRVVSNDHNAYAHTLAQCYVEADRERHLDDTRRLVGELNVLPGRPGYFTETFCERSRFVQPHNGERIDAIREAIEQRGLEPQLRSVLLTSLMEAADRVDSTCGLQMAYVKRWSTRSFNALELRVPDLLVRPAAGACQAHRREANELAAELDTDVAYVDPPYNQHSYLSNYHVWESLVLWDKPEVYGVACKRIDCRERKSDYNSKPRHRQAFDALFDALRSPLWIVSFNNEGYVSPEAMETMLSKHGRVFVLRKNFKRYVGAQIGIHNPAGERVGKVSHLRNEELIYVVARPELRERIPDAERRLQRMLAGHAEVAASAP